MNFKKFAIVASVFIGVIIITLVVLACVHVNAGLKIDDPQYFKYYVNSATDAGQKDAENTPKIYNNLKKKFEKSTDLSILDYMAKGLSLKAKPTQDSENKFPSYTSNMKEQGVCLEVVFENKQSIVVEIDGGTKVVEFYSFIMQVKDSSKAEEVALYFSKSSGSYKDYTSDESNTIIIVAKQNKLYDYIMSLV